jgi:hypothetical protein
MRQTKKIYSRKGGNISIAPINNPILRNQSLEWDILDSEQLEEYGTEIEQLYLNSYSKIGVIPFADGYKGMKEYYPCSAYILRNNTILSVIMFWLSNYGNKIGLVISADPEIGKKYTIPMLITLLKTPGFYVELSDALEYLVRKEGLQNIQEVNTILKLIPGINESDIFSENDSRRKTYPLGKNLSPVGSYLRDIHGIGTHRKALYGIPCMSQNFVGTKCFRKCKKTNGGRRKTYKRKK